MFAIERTTDGYYFHSLIFTVGKPQASFESDMGTFFTDYDKANNALQHLSTQAPEQMKDCIVVSLTK